MACAIKDGGGTHTVSQAAVRVHADGSASVHVGSVEMGQGSHTTLAQIVIEELGLPPARVVVAPVNTSATPYDQGTSASRTATLMGEAVQKAARHARDQLAEFASGMLGCAPEAVRFEDGFAAGPDRKLPVAEVIAGHFGMPGGEVVGLGSFLPRPLPNEKGSAVAYWEIGAGAASVAVDLETGKISILGYASAADVGAPVNPLVVEGQDEGAAMQGIGHVLFEALQYESGQLLNGNLVEYRVPTFEELPEEFESVLVEDRDGPGPYGLKGVGESGVISAAPAVANAVFQATGIRLRRLPLSPESIWRALKGDPSGSPSSTEE
jgi:CO/xanthine dehydrogenase Mo-binding subunit